MFTPVTYNTGAGPGLDGPAFNAMQLQYQEAILSFEQDLFTPFVFSGCAATKDGTTPSQLDVTAGVAFLTQSDGTERRQAPTSTTFSTSGHPSTTMYLFLRNDGTYSWQTSSTGPTNSLAIAQVTTDGSSNILAVTDKRFPNPSFMAGMMGSLSLPSLLGVTAHTFSTSTDDALYLYDRTGVRGAQIGWSQGGAGLYAWDAVNSAFIFQQGTKSGITFTGSVTGTEFMRTASLGGANQTIVEVNPSGGPKHWGIVALSSGGFSFYDFTDSLTWLTSDASGNVGIAGNVTAPYFNGKLQTNRNGTTQANTIFTGSSTPSSPSVGDVWLNA